MVDATLTPAEAESIWTSASIAQRRDVLSRADLPQATKYRIGNNWQALSKPVQAELTRVMSEDQAQQAQPADAGTKQQSSQERGKSTRLAAKRHILAAENGRLAARPQIPAAREKIPELMDDQGEWTGHGEKVRSEAMSGRHPELQELIEVKQKGDTVTRDDVKAAVARYFHRTEVTTLVRGGGQLATDVQTAWEEHIPGGLNSDQERIDENQRKFAQEDLARKESKTSNKSKPKTVSDAIRQQLDATGRFDAETHAAYAELVAAYYENTAKRLKLTPMELFQRYPLNITASGKIEGGDYGQALASQPPKGWKHIKGGLGAATLWHGKSDAQAVFWTDLKGKLAQDLPALAGYSHSLDREHITHIKTRHGNETRPGQLSVTAADIAKIPDIVTHYDEISPDVRTKDSRGNTLRNVVYAKETPGGTLIYVETVSKQRKNMRGVTMLKYPPSVSASTALKRANATITSETHGGMPESVDQEGTEYNQSAYHV
ncbi:hypothetical protein FACS189497_09320 [Betaproteobacteria bacterium]|nr:hypothetical protein FACS189497_09320 [Betaproteobacteria bacterium]